MKRSYTLARLFLLCSALFLLNACSKQGDDNNEYVIKEMFYGDRNKYSYEYNDKWQLTKSTYSYTATPDDVRNNITTYFYNTDGRLEYTESVYQGNTLDAGRDEYFYNNEGKVALIKNYKANQGSPVFTGKVEYSYNGQQIVETISGVNSIYKVVTFTLDDNGNIVKKVTKSPNDLSRTEMFLDYDDKKNVGGPVAGSVAPKNNYRTYSSTYYSTTKSYLKYVYNDAGYVTKRITFGERLDMGVTKYILIPKK